MILILLAYATPGVLAEAGATAAALTGLLVLAGLLITLGRWIIVAPITRRLDRIEDRQRLIADHVGVRFPD